MTNLEEIKRINRIALMQEMVEKTKKCGLVWNKTEPNQYHSQYQDYDFFATRTNATTYSLDVLKNGQIYRTYNSSTQEGVDTLFKEIESTTQNCELKKYKKVNQIIDSMRTCRDGGSSILVPSSSYGVRCGGGLMPEQTRFESFFITPTSMYFGPSPFPWTNFGGSFEQVLTVNDGDSSFIRQQVSGELPTNWGYAFAAFDTSYFSSYLNPPYKFRINVSHRREVNIGVALNIDLLVNNSVFYSTYVLPGVVYNTFDSGIQDMTNINGFSQLTLRFSMYTNSGNALPRAVRITYASLDVSGYTLIND